MIDQKLLQLEHEELHKLDKEISQFNVLYDSFFRAFGNSYAKDVIRSRVLELESGISSLDLAKYSHFESLFVENIIHALTVQLAMADFLPEDSGDSGKMYDFALGEGSYDSVEILFANYDFELSWKAGRAFDDIRLSYIRTDTQDVQKEIERIIPEIKENVLIYAKQRGILPEDFDFKLVKLPPTGEQLRSSWNSDLKRMQLADHGLIATERDGKIEINPTEVYFHMFHEVLGHAVHDYYSKNLPATLRLDGYGAVNIISKPVKEGIARIVEDQTPLFLKENKEKLGISNSDIERSELSVKSKYQQMIFHIAHRLFKERKFREPRFDIYKYVKTLTAGNVTGARLMNEKDAEYTFGQAILESAYFIGAKLVEKLRAEMQAKFGEKLEKHPEAIMTGAWGWKTYPKFVEWYLENVED